MSFKGVLRLSCYYNEGISTERDFKKAANLFEKSASKGNVFAQATLARPNSWPSYTNGVPRSPSCTVAMHLAARSVLLPSGKKFMTQRG